MNNYILNVKDINLLVEDYKRKKGFTGTVAIFRNQEVLFEKSVFDIHRPLAKSLSLNSAFGMASAAKIFTAIAISQLQEQGLLSFEDVIGKYLFDEFPNIDKNTKIKHLVTHSSGIEEYFNECESDGYESVWRQYPVYNIRNTQDYYPILKDKGMYFSPGEEYRYNNTGFVLLGMIIERVSGVPFVEYIIKNIFLPANMEDSGYYAVDKLPSHAVLGHVFDTSSRKWKSNVFLIPAVGGGEGGAFCSAADLDRLWKAILNNTLMNNRTTKEFLSAQIQDGCDGEWFYAYGFWVNYVNKQVLKYTCIGEDPGCSVRYYYYPETAIGLAVMSNISEGAGELSVDMQRLLFPDIQWESDQPATLQACNVALASCSNA